MRKLGTYTLAVLAAAGFGLSAVPAAQASTTHQASAETVVSLRGKVPSCVNVWSRTGRVTKTGYAQNNCGRTLHMKIVWAHGADGDCQTAYPGKTISYWVPRGIRTFDGAKTC
ncbi:hypothetical protein FHR32_002181 [Streptosporangium album]|uniref:Alpha amylase inhibitor n=1 Tax=Streptosporangium album TaxID=47479 RepID=A0A7W7W8J7_9ACTN|nr:hypothetical protein [Streptosporangium album]MBB4937876.1 hypothetical protein [Streptosporangium album]